MKAVILAGGLGTRLGEETNTKPKPMVEIGDRPILWHIMKIYSHYGIQDFIICLGYKGYLIKEYFSNYFLHMSDVTFDLRDDTSVVHQNAAESWRVTLVDTGATTMTGGRLRRVREYLDGDTFLLTYGDGVADVDVRESIQFHGSHDGLATVTAVRPPGRFGRLSVDTEDRVQAFCEKPDGDGDWINGGFFVLEPEVIDLVTGDETMWEREPLERLAALGQLRAFRHHGFWLPMDTLRDKQQLESLWATGAAPWKVWEDGPPAAQAARSQATPDDHLGYRQGVAAFRVLPKAA